MVKEIIDKLREDYSWGLVTEPSRARDISKWISGNMPDIDDSEDEIDDLTVVIDTPSWSAEVIGYEFEDIIRGHDIVDCFVSIRYKDVPGRDMTCFHEDDLSLENIKEFLERDRISEFLERKKYKDSMLEPKRFDGDIVITDPCYVTETAWDDPDVDIYDGQGFEKYFGPTYIYGSTIYGDWSCTTFDIGSEDPLEFLEKKDKFGVSIKNIGRFCADAGLVCVVYLSKCSDKFRETSGDWTRTIIKDFHGTIQYVIHNEEDVHIIGRSDDGLHNFITLQTGL